MKLRELKARRSVAKLAVSARCPRGWRRAGDYRALRISVIMNEESDQAPTLNAFGEDLGQGGRHCRCVNAVPALCDAV